MKPLPPIDDCLLNLLAAKPWRKEQTSGFGVARDGQVACQAEGPVLILAAIVWEAAAALHDHADGSAAPHKQRMVGVYVGQLAFNSVVDHALCWLRTRVYEIFHGCHQMGLHQQYYIFGTALKGMGKVSRRGKPLQLLEY